MTFSNPFCHQSDRNNPKKPAYHAGESNSVYLRNKNLRSTMDTGKPSHNHATQNADLVPGVMRCAKCSFQLHRVNLYVRSGKTGAGGNETEPCPNGCGPLWPVTWQQWAKEAIALHERCFDDLTAERKKLARLEKAARAMRQDIVDRIEPDAEGFQPYDGNLEIWTEFCDAMEAAQAFAASNKTFPPTSIGETP